MKPFLRISEVGYTIQVEQYIPIMYDSSPAENNDYHNRPHKKTS